jgi:opacity protein-like surface antigen
MRTLTLLALLLAFGAAPAAAQDVPKAEISAGYAFLHDEETHEGLHGWLVSATGNLNRWLGVTAEYGQNHKTVGDDGHFDVNAFMAGPRVSLRRSKVVPFAHVLFGAHHEHHGDDGAFDEDETRFAWQAGGGIDVWFTPKAALRLGGDFRHIPDSHSAHEHHSELRFHAGIVVGLGTR